MDTRPTLNVHLLPQKHMWVLCKFPINRLSTSLESKYKLQYKGLVINFLCDNTKLTKTTKLKLIQ